MATLLDTSAWLDYWFGPNPQIQSVVDSDEPLLISVLSIYETKRKLMKMGQDRGKRDRALEFLKRRAVIIPVDLTIAEMAADISNKHNLSTADSIIYSTASLKGARLITCDLDFKKMPNVDLY